MANIILNAALVVIIVSLIISAYRFAIGPKIINRIVTFDVMGFISMSFIVLISYFAHRVIYLDVALVYGLLAFLGVVVVARFIERGL